MKRFFVWAAGKIGRFFWSWGFLKLVLWGVTIVVLFYVEEDWRGARTWAMTEAEWEAKGESFDFNKFIPRPIPDEQNLGAIQLFELKLERVASHPNEFDYSQRDLWRALRRGLPGRELPKSGNRMLGEGPDMAKIRSGIAANYAAAFKGATPPGDALTQFDALYPFVPDLLAASATRPQFRFKIDYTILPPFLRPLAPITMPIELCQILTLHAILALDEGRADLAVADIETNYKLLDAAKVDPSLVGGLVALGVNAISMAAVSDGSTRHLWSDAQLVQIDRTLAAVDFLEVYRFDMRSEANVSSLNIDYIKSSASYRRVGRDMGLADAAPAWYGWLEVPFNWPRGWWDLDKSRVVSFELGGLASVDPARHRVFPDVEAARQNRTDAVLARWDAFAPWSIWFTSAAPPLSHVVQKYAYGQAWVDEARIACALERFRLAHGVYPESLNALVPAYLAAVPGDVCNGEGYRYRVRADGTFQLYSVGWNRRDEGGKVVFKKDAPTQIEYLEGDWVWPSPLEGKSR